MAGENRGFVLNGQRVVLDLDFAGSLKATAYLTIKPTNVRLSTVFLHAAPCLRIMAIQLSGPDVEDPLPALPASFNHYNPLLGLYEINDGQPMNPNAPDAIQRHPDVKRKLWTAMAEKDEGELAIDVSHGWVRIAQAKEGSQTAQAGLAEILITIDYEIAMSDVDTEGIVWRRPGDAGNDYVCTVSKLGGVVGCLFQPSYTRSSECPTSLSTHHHMTPLVIGRPASIIYGIDVHGN
jgi:transcription initiation factor TFIID subunit 2